MKISDLLKKEIMIMDLSSSSKNEVIDEMIEKLKVNGIINDDEEFRKEILNREDLSSTGLGDGIAMPHAKTKAVNTPCVLFAKSKAGVDYDSLDGQPTYLFFMIAAEEGANNTHIETLASLSRLLLQPNFIELLKEADTPEKVLELIESGEAQLNEEKKKKEEKSKTSMDNEKPLIVAVTACPTGIAHTYMAEDALLAKAEKMGVNIRVETNGSDGAKNVLTDEEIKKAVGVIVSADKNVEMARFKGKKLIKTPVSEAIRNPEELITKTLNGEGAVYETTEESTSSAKQNEKTSIGSKIYKDVMNGVSHMLPFVVGGGILIAISFMAESSFGAESQIYKFLMDIGGNGAFTYLIPILAGYIAMSIADRPGLMPGMVGGLMAAQQGAGFLGGLAAGFIAGYVILGLKKLTSGLPKSLEGIKPMIIYPVFGLLITGLIMFVAVIPVFSVINTAMNNSLTHLGTGNAILLGAVLGGMMAVDMGGPVNKAAYTFSIGVFTSTNMGNLMAAVMAGGMVPPLAIALATTVFKNKFDEKEKQSGLTNWILGLTFITEGAIPFAAADPVRVIGSSVVGAAIAGGLTQLWNVNAPAPHGGVLVSFVMQPNHVIFFLLSIAIGTVISGMIYGIWRRPKAQ
ncbi:MAG: fructose-specific PTS transporter subunit EIIC [Peptostreptococcus porci]|uniref:PTS fructose transporter subunit IIABC n=1 Tax=Peptostreptococcus porci TaxID=2652282 RepID=UPI002A7577D9|nr:fructose-specific PTS transporter subunit EIIC [Peptostreptococcus porci]MDY2793794.1 fructose-specific PTS transporter subunit EIIC [Peptostreptococcus porci]MDY5479782.1 fructose-specific PTS transporter subunit EIIC [Peptostreptococcus porci]